MSADLDPRSPAGPSYFRIDNQNYYSDHALALTPTSICSGFEIAWSLTCRSHAHLHGVCKRCRYLFDLLLPDALKPAMPYHGLFCIILPPISLVVDTSLTYN